MRHQGVQFGLAAQNALGAFVLSYARCAVLFLSTRSGKPILPQGTNAPIILGDLTAPLLWDKLKDVGFGRG